VQEDEREEIVEDDKEDPATDAHRGSRGREIRTPGSAGGGGGNSLVYPPARQRSPSATLDLGGGPPPHHTIAISPNTGNQTASAPALGPTNPSETKWNEGEDTPIFLVAGARPTAPPHPLMRLSPRPLRSAAPARRPPRRDREAAGAATSPKATSTANPSRPRQPRGRTQAQQGAADRVETDRVVHLHRRAESIRRARTTDLSLAAI